MAEAKVSFTKTRHGPNILVMGRRGVYQSTLCGRVSEMTGIRWVEISKVATAMAEDNDNVSEFKPVKRIMNRDRLVNRLKEQMSVGGNLVDYDSISIFPDDWFDAVFVLKADITTTYDRDGPRSLLRDMEEFPPFEEYSPFVEYAPLNLLQMMRREPPNPLNYYSKPEILHRLPSCTPETIEANVDIICHWVQKWYLNKK